MPVPSGLPLSLHESCARLCGAWKHRVASVGYLPTGASLVEPIPFAIMCAAAVFRSA